MSKHNAVELSGRDTSRNELTQLIREGARKLISEALEAEVSELLSTLSGRREASGRAREEHISSENKISTKTDRSTRASFRFVYDLVRRAYRAYPGSIVVYSHPVCHRCL